MFIINKIIHNMKCNIIIFLSEVLNLLIEYLVCKFAIILKMRLSLEYNITFKFLNVQISLKNMQFDRLLACASPQHDKKSQVQWVIVGFQAVRLHSAAPQCNKSRHSRQDISALIPTRLMTGKYNGKKIHLQGKLYKR